MMKFVLMLFSIFIFITPVHAAEKIKVLPQPVLSGGKPLMETLNKRHSAREFDAEKVIDDQTLSNILWSAWGINRKDGKRVIPTSRNKQDLKVYALTPDGVWLYDAEKNALLLITDSDLRSLLATQAYVKTAPLTLVYSGQADDGDNVRLHAGSAYQNVGLYAASVGLNNVVRAYFDTAELAKAMKMDSSESIVISQTIGWPK